MRKEPAISGSRRILLAGHGAPRHAAAQQSILAQAARLEDATGVLVRAGFLTADPSVGEAAAALGDGPITVLPMFMADGYLVRRAVPRGLGREAQCLAPLGLMPSLAGLIVMEALNACASSALLPSHSTLLLVGHGSAGSAASRDAVTAQAHRVAKTGKFRTVEAAYLEEPPTLDEQLLHCRGDLVVTGFFAAPGAHASQDVPRLLRDDPQGNGRRVVYTGAIGAHPGVVALLAEAVRSKA